ncbi:hypothetical protein ABFV55_19105, partial [Pseudomonas syringae]|uniref:hypothetical protein n=1 Tax=Pseudomonas syringae TaxID=317 RepID=UPI0034D986D0
MRPALLSPPAADGIQHVWRILLLPVHPSGRRHVMLAQQRLDFEFRPMTAADVGNAHELSIA